jgi:hypothetical protein
MGHAKISELVPKHSASGVSVFSEVDLYNWRE